MKLFNFGKCRILRGGGSTSSVKSALRRGFTIMELVIVIAVIAVLAAVLIPTFANLTQRANESADMQTVENLNTILMSEETISGEKPATMSEAIAQAASGGYNVAALSPTSDGNDILWDQTSIRFVLADGETGEIIHKDDATAATETDNGFWKIYSSEEEINSDKTEDGNKYSIYLADDFTFSGERALTVTAGVDVGNNSDIDVSYADNVAETVVFNMNGGDLSVDNEEGTQSFYGTANALTVTATDPENCMHVYGVVRENIAISNGKLVIGDNISVNLIEVFTANVTIENNGYIENVISETGDITIVGEKPSNNFTTVVIDSVEDLSVFIDSDNYSGSYRLEADLTIPTHLTIEEGFNVIIDFNGHTITYGGAEQRPLTNYGTLILKNGAENSIEEGKGGITCTSQTVYGAINNYGDLIIYGGYYSDNSDAGNSVLRADVEATTIVYNGSFVSKMNSAVYNLGNMVIYDGYYYTTSSNRGNYAYCVRSAGSITIYGGEVYGIQGGIAIFSGSATIYDCTVTVDDILFEQYNDSNKAFYALYVAGEAGTVSTTVYGGNFRSSGVAVVLVGNDYDGGNKENAYLAIYGGTFEKLEQRGNVVTKLFGTNGTQTGLAILYGGRYDENPASQVYIADNYSVIENGGYFLVVSD